MTAFALTLAMVPGIVFSQSKLQDLDVVMPAPALDTGGPVDDLARAVLSRALRITARAPALSEPEGGMRLDVELEARLDASTVERVLREQLGPTRPGEVGPEVCVVGPAGSRLGEPISTSRWRWLHHPRFGRLVREATAPELRLDLELGELTVPMTLSDLARDLRLDESEQARGRALLEGAREVSVRIEPLPRPRAIDLALQVKEGRTRMLIGARASAAKELGAGLELSEGTRVVLEVAGRGRAAWPVSEAAVNRSAWLTTAALRSLEGASGRLAAGEPRWLPAPASEVPR